MDAATAHDVGITLLQLRVLYVLCDLTKDAMIETLEFMFYFTIAACVIKVLRECAFYALDEVAQISEKIDKRYSTTFDTVMIILTIYVLATLTTLCAPLGYHLIITAMDTVVPLIRLGLNFVLVLNLFELLA